MTRRGPRFKATLSAWTRQAPRPSATVKVVWALSKAAFNNVGAPYPGHRNVISGNDGARGSWYVARVPKGT